MSIYKGRNSKILVGTLLAATLLFMPSAYAAEEQETLQSRIEDVTSSKQPTQVQTQAPIEVNLTDIDGHWGADTIKFLVSHKAISGYPDGSFQPDKAISRAEFLTIAMKAANNGNVPASTGGHWASGTFDLAQDKGILFDGEMPESKWNEPISRYEMAMVAVRITENMLGESKASTRGVAHIMSDYGDVQEQDHYTYYVEQAFMKGIVSGMDSQGTYTGFKGATRAESSVVVSRILEASRRRVVDVEKLSKSQPASSRVISATDTNRPLIPKAGDVFVKADGTKVVLKVGPSGVLGEGQGIAYHNGIVGPNGHVFKEGDLGTFSMGFPGETYLISREGEGHFVSEWNKISDSHFTEAYKIQNPKNGQMYGQWCYYEDGQWFWIGPVNG